MDSMAGPEESDDFCGWMLQMEKRLARPAWRFLFILNFLLIVINIEVYDNGKTIPD